MSVYSPDRARSRTAVTLAGKIAFPHDAGFDRARSAWNLAVDQRPAAVVFPETVEDVVAAIELALDHGLQVAPQGTGHNPAPLGDLSNAILMKTERMRGVSIDAVSRVARVEAGAVWIEVVEAAAARGLAALAGSSPDVGVVGYTLGGGVSWLGRKYGLAANHVHAIELVTADGEFVRADHDRHPDLFWALRGGGGNFGVVTAIEIELFPITDVYAGILWYPMERGREVLHAWREVTSRELPDELTTVGRLLALPPLPEIPEAVRGKSFVAVEAYHLGAATQADALLEPLRRLGPVNDTLARVPMPALSHVHMDPEHPVPGAGDGASLATLPEAAVDALVEVAGADSGSPLLSVEVRHFGGELGRARPGGGALGRIDAAYGLYAVGIAPTAGAKDAVSAHIDAVKQAMAPWTARHTYLNFADTSREASTFWSEEAYRRLLEIKAAVNPDDVIRANHPIPLAR